MTTKRKPSTIEKVKAVAEFATDGCTMSTEIEFTECCNKHDVQYSISYMTRAQADRQLRHCIRNKGYPVLCWVYWIGVRLFGWIPYYFGTSYDYRKKYDAHMLNAIKTDD